MSAGAERLSPREQERINGELLRMAEADPANWRGWTHPDGTRSRYYVGPRWSGDGTINWHDDGWPE